MRVSTDTCSRWTDWPAVLGVLGILVLFEVSGFWVAFAGPYAYVAIVTVAAAALEEHVADPVRRSCIAAKVQIAGVITFGIALAVASIISARDTTIRALAWALVAPGVVTMAAIARDCIETLRGALPVARIRR